MARKGSESTVVKELDYLINKNLTILSQSGQVISNKLTMVENL